MKQNFAGWTDINKLAVKQVGRWAVYVSNGLELATPKENAIWEFVLAEIKKLYPDDVNMLCNLVQSGLFFFDTEAEMEAFYSIFDAPLTDSSAIFACTYEPSGECLTENT